ACARLGHRVTLLEARQRIDDSPRASTTQPPTLEIVAELGLIDEYIRQGLIAKTFQFWDRPTRRLIAEFDFGRLQGETAYPYVVQTEQHKLANMAIERLRAIDGSRVLMGEPVVSLAQDEKQVTVKTKNASFSANYVSDCDGDRSKVRRVAGIEFDSYTQPDHCLINTTKFYFAASLG